MDIDIYQQCPCHSGKKIKFCCGKDIVSELNQIVAKCQSNQAQSALDSIERVISKSGERDCLLALQTHIFFKLGEVEKARESNAKFATDNPGHPIKIQHDALLLLADGEVRSAISRLQDAMDAVKSDEIPGVIANAFRLIGSILLSGGHLLGARAHLQFAAMLRDEQDQELSQLIYEANRATGAPIVLKTDFRLESPPEDKEWAGKYQNVIRAMNRGQFRLGLRILERIDEIWPDQREVVRSIAILNSILANEDKMAGLWRRLSRLHGIPHWQTVEYEAIALLFDENEQSGSLEIIAAACDLSNLEEVLLVANSSNRMVATSCPEEDLFGEGPGPRHAFHVLDRDKLEKAEGIGANDIPLVVGDLLLYGKQTDRNARFVLIATRNEAYDSTLQLLRNLFSEAMLGELEEDVISETSVASDTLTWNWQIPSDLEIEQHKSLIAEYRRTVLLEKWPVLQFNCLGDKTPLQVKDDSELALPLEALVLNLEQSAAIQASGSDDIGELKSLLGIAEQELQSAAEVDISTLTPLQLRHIDPKSLSDEQLQSVFADSMRIANTAVLINIVPEILDRESIGDAIPRDMCYSMLAQLTDDNEKALEYLSMARHEANQAGHNSGLYLVQEMDIRLARGMTDKLPELLQTIQKRHLQDPNVEYQLARVLTKYGLIGPDGRTISLPVAASDEASEPESQIWTPDSAEPSVATGETSGESKLWIPGSD